MTPPLATGIPAPLRHPRTWITLYSAMTDQGDNPWRVALCISRELGCKERLISGVCRAAREAGDWDMSHVPPEPGVIQTLDWFKPQGVVFHRMRPFPPPHAGKPRFCKSL